MTRLDDATDPVLPARWRLRQAELLADTRTSRVWKVLREDGSPAVVKALKPAGMDERHGIHLLRWRRGRGLVRLHGVVANCQLLEYAGAVPLSAVITREGDDAATRIAAEVLRTISAPSVRPAPAGLTPLAEHFTGLFQQAAAAPAQSPYRRAAELAAQLLRDMREIRPLHGDLHHDNIHQGARGWLAIDPRGLLGDPAYDAANLLYNPLERDDLCLDPRRLRARTASYAAALRREPAEILAWAYAYGCLSAAWHAEDGNTADEQRELDVAAVIDALLRPL